MATPEVPRERRCGWSAGSGEHQPAWRPCGPQNFEVFRPKALTSRRDRVTDIRRTLAWSWATHAYHHSPHHCGTNAAASSRRRSCPKHPLALAPAGYVDLDQAHEEAAVDALADQLVPYLESNEDAA